MKGLIRRNDVLNEASSGIWDIPRSEIEGVLSQIEDVELEHFLEVEIQLTTERLKDKSNPCYDGVCVGSTEAAELKKKHIKFCKQLLSIIEK